MTDHARTSARRHALHLALAYLLIRGLPELLAWSWVALPESLRAWLAEHAARIIAAVWPPHPLNTVLYAPYRFELWLNSLPLLLVETLLVYLVSAWMLRDGYPEVGRAALRRAWAVMVAATLAWSVAARHALFGMWIERQRARARAHDKLDAIAAELLGAYWEIMPVIFLSALVWAAVPAWLHFRALGATAQGARAPLALARPFRRVCVAASFMLGFLVAQHALVQAVHFALWPWLVQLNDIFVSHEELQALDVPLAIGQVALPILAGAVASVVYSAGARADNGSSLIGVPALAGLATPVLANLAMLVLAWLLAYVDYPLFEGLLLSIGYGPDMVYVLLILFNLLGLALVCGVAMFLRGPRQGAAPAPGGPGLSAT